MVSDESSSELRIIRIVDQVILILFGIGIYIIGVGIVEIIGHARTDDDIGADRRGKRCRQHGPGHHITALQTSFSPVRPGSTGAVGQHPVGRN